MHAALAEITRLEKEPGPIAVRFSGMSNDDYHAAPGTSHSQSVDLIECPDLFHRKHIAKTVPRGDPSKPMLLGSAVHALAGEGREAFNKQFIYEKVFSGTGSKALREEWKASVPAGVATLSESMRADVEGMSASLLKLHELQAMRDGNNLAEEAFFVRDEGTNGELIKAKFDILNGPLGVAGDYKTAGKGAGADAFKWAVLDKNYASQAAWYLEVLQRFTEFEKVDEFIFFAVGSAAPYLAATYRLKQEDIEVARGAVRNRLATLAECRRTGIWPGFNNGELTDLEFTTWDLKKIAQ